MSIRSVRQLLAMLSLGGLLLAPSPSWAATRSKRPAKPPVDAATSTGATCLTGTSSPGAEATQPTDADRKLGTAVTWMPTPDAAARAAVDENKLVFMIQVSGNFARQEFT